MGHVVILETSRVRVLLCYFAFRGTEYVGSCKICNLLFLKSLVMERIFVFRVVIYFSIVVLVAHDIPEFFS